MDQQSKQQGQYQYQRKSPLPLQNVTQSYQNVQRYKENDDSPISASSNNQSYSTKNKQKLDQSQKHNQIITSQEIVSKYNNFLLSTKSASKSQTSTATAAKRTLNIDHDEQLLSSKHELTKTSPISIQTSFSHSKSPIRPLFSDKYSLERTKSEDRIANNKNCLALSKSSTNLALTHYKDFKIDHESNNSTNEFKLQLIRKLGELEIELKKESIKNQNLEYDNKNLRSTIHKLQDQFKSQSKDNLDLRKTVDSLNKEITEYIKMQQEEKQVGQQEKKLQQILEKTDIEQKLSKECDRLAEIVDEKESQINKLVEKFMNLKESKKDQASARDFEIEKQQSTLKYQILNEQNESKQIKLINNQLQSQVEELVKEKERFKLSNQMLQEQLKQNTQIIHSQQTKLQDIDNHYKNGEQNKRNFDERLEEMQKMKEDLEQRVIDLEQSKEEYAYKNRELKNQQQKSEKQIVQQKQKYEERIGEYQSVLQDLRKQINDTSIQLAEQRSTLKLKGDECNQQRESIYQLKEQVKKLSDDLNEKNEKLISYSKKESLEKSRQLGFTQTSEVEQLRLKTRLQELEQELQIQRCEYDRLITKISEMQKLNDDLLNQMQTQQRAHKTQLDELEHKYKEQSQSQIEREVKNAISENERIKFFSENQTKLLEKQLLAYKDKVENVETEMASQLKERHEQIQQLKDQIINQKKSFDQTKEEKNKDMKERISQFEDNIKKMKIQNEDLQNQVKGLQEQQVRTKEKDEQTKKLSQQVIEYQKKMDQLQQESRLNQQQQKEAEKKLYDKVQEAIQKFNRDLRLKDQDIQFFEKENENLNRIITQQKMSINQLQNRIQKNIVSQNEEDLLKQLGLNELIYEKNNFSNMDEQNCYQEKKIGQQIQSSSSSHNLPSFKDESKLQPKTNLSFSKKNLFDQVQNSNMPTNYTWKDALISDTEWKIEKQNLSNWSHDDQMIEKLQDQQQISFSLQQQCFQHEENDQSDVQSDVEEFHIPLYQEVK